MLTHQGGIHASGLSVRTLHHPSADWPGERAPNAQSPVIVFHTSDVTMASLS